MNASKILAHAMLFTCFFFIFYIENIELSGIKIAILWKIILIVLAMAYLTIKGWRTSKLSFSGYLYSIKCLLTTGIAKSTASEIALSVKSIFIPLFYQLFLLILKKRKTELSGKILLSLAAYIILSTVPFLIGIVPPLSAGYDLSIFGSEGHGFVGVFAVAHSASVTTAFAVIILLYNIKKTRTPTQNLLLLTLAAVGIYVVLQTYARIGIAVLAVSGAYLFSSKKMLKNSLKALPVIAAALFLFDHSIQSSEILKMRLLGENIYIKSSEEGISSGRDKFAIAALSNFIEGDFTDILIGVGQDQAMEKMLSSVGMRIYAHNGFIDVLQFNGLLGAAIYSIFFYCLVNLVRKNKNSPHQKISTSLFLGYLVVMLFQGERFFLPDLIFAISLAALSVKTQPTPNNIHSK